MAADQTLRIAVPNDIGVFESFDPAQIATDLDYSIGQNIFGGLYRFDEHLGEVPDLATAMPEISVNGLRYTIDLREDARFSNGDPVTAQDVLYSWKRARDALGTFAYIFHPIAGLYAPNPHRVVIQLTASAGYFTAELALPVAWVLDQAVIKDHGEETWWQSPAGIVGTGPFRMASRTPGHSITLVPVEPWWRGPTGVLKKVVIDVVPDSQAVLRAYLDGQVDLVGLGDYGPDSIGVTVGKAVKADPAHSHEVHSYPYGRTDWIGFNVGSGPFADVSLGRSGRLALSLAIDRVKLAKAVCGGGTLCVPATGGLISKGLDGYLGDGVDPTSGFDPATARADLDVWDPGGTRRQHLTYVYIANSLFRQVANNLRAQWQQNLGISVALQGYDTHTFLYDRFFGDYTMFRGSWSGDYDSPQDWYDLFIGEGNPTGSRYAYQPFFTLLSGADASSGAAADLTYRQAGKMLLDQAIVAPLFYYTRTAVVKPYVDGFGANALYVYPWLDISIRQH